MCEPVEFDQCEHCKIT